jgi:hypothetical protein
MNITVTMHRIRYKFSYNVHYYWQTLTKFHMHWYALVNPTNVLDLSFPQPCLWALSSSELWRSEVSRKPGVIWRENNLHLQGRNKCEAKKPQTIGCNSSILLLFAGLFPSGVVRRECNRFCKKKKVPTWRKEFAQERERKCNCEDLLLWGT